LYMLLQQSKGGEHLFEANSLFDYCNNTNTKPEVGKNNCHFCPC
jgi:hypothetical protein